VKEQAPLSNEDLRTGKGDLVINDDTAAADCVHVLHLIFGDAHTLIHTGFSFLPKDMRPEVAGVKPSSS